MKKALRIVAGLLICGAITSCVSTTFREPISISCVVQPEAPCHYEMYLDDNFVFSGQANPQGMHTDRLMATPGNHLLRVAAAGHTVWERTITVLKGDKNNQQFWIVLRKNAAK